MPAHCYVFTVASAAFVSSNIEAQLGNVGRDHTGFRVVQLTAVRGRYFFLIQCMKGNWSCNLTIQIKFRSDGQ